MLVNQIGSVAGKFWSKATMIRGTLWLVLVFAGWGPAAAAPDNPARSFPAELTKQDRTWITRIQTYLNTLTTIESRFVQISSTGDFAEGRLFISRPGRLRIEYDEPNPNLIIADGIWLIHYDKELEQATHVLLSSTLASVLLDKKIAFDAGRLAITAFEHDAGVIRLSAVQAEDPEEGTVTLVFSENPLLLRKWTVADPQGVLTTVAFQDPRFGRPLDPKLFHLNVDTKPNIPY